MGSQDAFLLNQEVFKNLQISSHENMIIKSLDKFYENKENMKIFIPIVNSESNISIRLIDYFVTKYSKLNKINYKLKENNIDQIFNVFSSYKQQLKAYQKKHFDPFSRGDRIPYFMGEYCIITTIGQLNFFRWFISKKLHEYIGDNFNIIEIDMNKKNKIDKIKEKKIPKIKKQKILSNNYNYNSYRNNLQPINLNSKSHNLANKIIVSFNFF